jgi:ribulose 1,5-bisphosphate synthetase/thiazole synthase
MKNEQFDVIIVGGGEGALACGSLLAKNGVGGDIATGTGMRCADIILGE